MSTTELSSSTPATPAASVSASAMLESLRDYRRRFAAAADGYDASTGRAADLEELMGDFSAFVTDERNATPFAELDDVAELVADLRTQSARCAAVMEKYRALRLLEGRSGSAGYFANVESCIHEEFGAVSPTAESQVLLVGSGSYPMTLFNVAERTGASAVGVDIDAEAVELGRRVVALLGGGFDIALENVPAEELDVTSNATHIVFSSTVPVKYEILHRLHAVTRDDVVVAMRFGDGLKSLFNYPMQDVDPARWRLLETVRRPGQVFDIALYAKNPAAREAE